MRRAAALKTLHILESGRVCHNIRYVTYSGLRTLCPTFDVLAGSEPEDPTDQQQEWIEGEW
jgi:hypothetical protein